MKEIQAAKPEFMNCSIKKSRKLLKPLLSIQEDMTSDKSPTQRSISELSRRSAPKRKRKQNPNHSIQPPLKKARYAMPARSCSDKPIPSIEKESYLQRDIIFEEDDPGCEVHSTPVFIRAGVLVGFWYADMNGNGMRPVYCLVKRDLEFAYRKGKKFISVRYYDFDPLDRFGDWMGDDAEDENAMSPKMVKMWAQNMWKHRNYAGSRDMTLEDLTSFDNQSMLDSDWEGSNLPGV
ncbi:hypothetical protein TSTA_060330 [Talaromyces stipitatus ATCC 10500]|uniref:Uncharacterized protein n=1 Tax=Talaromyces stipitatus (strain ATCC 10500 / CBS 375.48 / QM 6759 / NRRL 1006) TaxID=441959 RepID=B8LU66_TALSN|nr:uncharacterized protein TSTA_060330 [Talaromyces stipitatus ATCC 10500]EED22538.1 hypothetical protein TSTA_060330 [Talaromyces stipitatus ATCC 10500]